MTTFAIAACVKNEAPYLREWIEYHMLVGVEHFYLYNNDSTDDTFDILAEYSDADVTALEWPGKGIQMAVFKDALRRTEADGVQWVMFNDCDEFLLPDKPQTEPSVTFRDTLMAYKARGYTSLELPVAMFGSNGHLKRQEGLVIERFTKRAAEPSSNGKSIVRPGFVAPIDYHRFEARHIAQLPWEHVRLNHYITKSKEEALAKVERGRADVPYNRNWPGFFFKCDTNEVEDTEILRYLPELRRRLGKEDSATP